MFPEPIYVVFDGPPSHTSGRFVECETAGGTGINAAQWMEHPSAPGLWCFGPLYTASGMADLHAQVEAAYREGFAAGVYNTENGDGWEGRTADDAWPESAAAQLRAPTGDEEADHAG